MDGGFQNIVVGGWVAMLGIVGLFLAAGAADNAMSVFGWGLVIFALVFVFGLIKRHFDRADEMRASAKVDTHG